MRDNLLTIAVFLHVFLHMCANERYTRRLHPAIYPYISAKNPKKCAKLCHCLPAIICCPLEICKLIALLVEICYNRSIRSE